MRFGDWWRQRRARLLQLWGVGIAASLLVTGASAMGYLEALQTRALDLLLRLQGTRFASDVVIVAIDDDAFESLGRRQPLSREYLARLLKALQRSGAAVVGADITLAAPATAGEDAALARAVLDFSHDGVSRVVLTDTPGTGPLADPDFLRAAVFGSDRMPVDDDGLIRRAALLIPQGSRPPQPALSLAIAARLGGMDRVALETVLRTRGGLIALPVWRSGGRWDLTGDPPVAVRPGDLWRINFVGPARSFLTIPSGAVVPLSDPALEVARDNPLRDRIVLVGGTFPESRDFFSTPYGLLPGVEVHANVVHMLVTRSFIRPSGWLTSLGLQVTVILVAGVVLVLLRPLAGTLVCIAGALLVGVPGSYLAFNRGGYWVDFLLPVIATSLLGLGADALARRRFRDSFGRHVSREVLAEVLAEAPSLGGERREVSVLFSDLRGFTTLSEKMPAEAVAARLNEYFAAMTSAIFAHRGMINDFIGDAVMAIFGAPLADPDHALHAAQSAVAMDQALQELNQRWEAAGLPVLRMGIGIHTGEVFAGNIGGEARVKYTVIGDTVNVASRLEGLNKELGTTILVTEETRILLEGRVDVKDRGEMPVKGRTHPLRVYELLAVHPDGGSRARG
ncbi:MAG: adenylate/guanylate cyclase domain-containing protein [Candidatus Rokubacteria bacterium]|nr:adenylate/guanylate cyclase domain-containing protein [Candidatus Rokubacteria bacterium]